MRTQGYKVFLTHSWRLFFSKIIMTHTHQAVKALIKKDGKYLVLESTYWADKILYHDLPWWRLSQWENEIEGLRREVMEELWVEIEIWKYLWEWDFIRIDNIKVSCKTYLCKLTEENIDITQNPSSDEDILSVTWMTRAELFNSKLFQWTNIYDIFKKLL